MDQYKKMITRQRKWMFYLLALIVLGWGGFTPFTRIFLGLLLGTTLSLYNLWVMQRKIDRFGQAVSGQGRTTGIGTFTRLATAALAVIIAMRFEEHFHLMAVILGLMTTYVVIMIDFALFRKQD
ncbi:ATP synthase protein I [Gracilibacillus boraciitolerans JCM 21714]|uniref:ATP synthase protein I n=1 Tax=Gracilibacillus boraciitolerans JCM 21714 TaxID=1298598 RepID=W4VH27_9BACI|nr:ATP synthase subunit I [Gracilibacillus boraciitolerans]GAE92507.1 ATP synthase protein I [Gracilibacillus boraciitolerans JCM 21714]